MRKILFAALLLATACGKKDDPTPAPVVPTQAAFQARLVSEVNEPVTLTNTSTNAVRYEWDFGNGQSSTVAAPTAVYTTPGNYTITLRAYTSDNRSSVATLAVKVGKRYLKSVVLTAISFTKPTGQPWQSSGGPNLYMRLGDAAGAGITTNTVNNFQPSMLPFTFTATGNIEIQRGATWGFIMYNHNLILADDQMQAWSLPIADPTSNRDAAGNGSYQLTGPASAPASYNVIVNYETR